MVDKTTLWTYCTKCKTEMNSNHYTCAVCEEEIDGVFCPELDEATWNQKTWSDCNADSMVNASGIDTLVCRHCAGTRFTVHCIGSYETAARCTECNMWYVVHSG